MQRQNLKWIFLAQEEAEHADTYKKKSKDLILLCFALRGIIVLKHFILSLFIAFIYPT